MSTAQEAASRAAGKFYDEERLGPSNDAVPGRKTLNDIVSEKARAVLDRRDAQRRALGIRDPVAPSMLIVEPGPGVEFSIDESGNRITEQMEVPDSAWIRRRIKEGSLNLIPRAEQGGPGLTATTTASPPAAAVPRETLNEPVQPEPAE